MPCPHEENLARWLEGTLEGDPRITLIEHLATCDECRHVAVLARLTKTEPVHALTSKQESDARRAVLAGRGRPARWLPSTLAAAATVTIVALLYFLLRPPASTSAPTAHTEDSSLRAATHLPAKNSTKAGNGAESPPHPAEPPSKILVLFRADFGAGVTYPHRLMAGHLVEDPPLHFVCATPSQHPALPSSGSDAQSWIGFEFPEALTYHPNMVLTLRYRTPANHLDLVVDGFHKDVPIEPTPTWVQSDFELKGASKEGVPIMAGNDTFRTLYCGIHTGDPFDVDFVEIRRPLD